LLQHALDSNPENRMAFQFLMAHQLLERRLLYARHALATSPQAREGPWPRHYAEALLLHRHLYPGIALGAQLPRVPPAVVTRFQSFTELMNRATDSPQAVQPQAWHDFGNTYWYYYFYGPLHFSSRPTDPGKS
jgi:hypothetical protein